MKIIRWDGETAQELRDEVAEEEPLEIRVQGRAVSLTMRTPGHDAELAAGFLLSEGLIQGREDLLSIQHCSQNHDGNILDVLLADNSHIDFARLTRHVFASSSCGLCGKATIESINAQFPPIRSKVVINARILANLPDLMRPAQIAFDRTGGLHAAALFNSRGKVMVVREDVGRHNAVDKVIGFSLLHGAFPLDDTVLLVSGRCSFEIMQKALAARIPVVAAVSAPSSLAVEFAVRSGQCLIGFLRNRQMNVYTHPHHINFSSAALKPA